MQWKKVSKAIEIINWWQTNSISPSSILHAKPDADLYRRVDLPLDTKKLWRKWGMGHRPQGRRVVAGRGPRAVARGP